jgi:uridine kinase
LIETIAAAAAALPDRSIVAIDGVDGAGKTTFGDRLKPLIERRGRKVLRASVDGFHNPRAIRYRRGKSDPLGYFLDSYDYAGLAQDLLDPFKSGETVVLTRQFDHRSDGQDKISEFVDANAIMVFDGIFLHRDELRHFWDFSIFLRVPFSVSFERMARRDGTDPDPDAESNRRYYRGQLLYLQHCKPEERADLVIEG